MLRSVSRLGLGALTAASLVFGVAAPAAAALPNLGDHGAQAVCRYKLAPYGRYLGAARLMRVAVLPPTLYTQHEPGLVGWRIQVFRRYDFNPWKRIFTSVTQKAEATPFTPAALTTLFATINSPLFLSDNRHADYRAVALFYWFNPDGSVARTERHPFGVHDWFRGAEYYWTAAMCDHGFLDEVPPAVP
jgi:hypothetical protein